MSTHILEVCRNANGHLLAYLSPKDTECGYRIAGPKAWGGSMKIAELEVSDRDLAYYVRTYAPEVLAELIAKGVSHGNQ